jgi:hypothetical protein
MRHSPHQRAPATSPSGKGNGSSRGVIAHFASAAPDQLPTCNRHPTDNGSAHSSQVKACVPDPTKPVRHKQIHLAACLSTDEHQRAQVDVDTHSYQDDAARRLPQAQLSSSQRSRSCETMTRPELLSASAPFSSRASFLKLIPPPFVADVIYHSLSVATRDGGVQAATRSPLSIGSPNR